MGTEDSSLSPEYSPSSPCGSANIYPVRFEFSPDWDGLERTAIFQAGCRKKSVPIVDGVCSVPAEVFLQLRMSYAPCGGDSHPRSKAHCEAERAPGGGLFGLDGGLDGGGLLLRGYRLFGPGLRNLDGAGLGGALRLLLTLLLLFAGLGSSGGS